MKTTFFLALLNTNSSTIQHKFYIFVLKFHSCTWLIRWVGNILPINYSIKSRHLNKCKQHDPGEPLINIICGLSLLAENHNAAAIVEKEKDTHTQTKQGTVCSLIHLESRFLPQWGTTIHIAEQYNVTYSLYTQQRQVCCWPLQSGVCVSIPRHLFFLITMKWCVLVSFHVSQSLNRSFEKLFFIIAAFPGYQHI